jgi:radical SAM superfamily enzyme YgiQ (UPF0313 family)
MMAAMLISVGVQVDIIDENVDGHLFTPRSRQLLRNADAIGIGVPGAPYIPEAIRVAKMLSRRDLDLPIYVGGPVISNLTENEFKTIFHEVDERLVFDPDGSKLLRVSPIIEAQDRYNTSMGPALHALPEYMQEAYFTRPWCLFTSDGCYYHCRFCAANKGVTERFRDRHVFEQELKVLMTLTQRYAGDAPDYEIYLSSLDGCQNPREMEGLLRLLRIITVSRGITLKLRFLATAKSVVRAARADPDMLTRWRNSYGITCIGLGVDGDDPVTWKKQLKQHNSRSEIRTALALIRAGGIQREALTVIGFPTDSPSALFKAARSALEMARHGIWVRPYLGKSLVPGTDGWEEDPQRVEAILQDPRLFWEMEYAALGSKLSHPDDRQRRLANLVFLGTIFTLKWMKTGCATSPLARTASVNLPRRLMGHLWNRRQPIDR